jgi:hypothetical protein
MENISGSAEEALPEVDPVVRYWFIVVIAVIRLLLL